MTPKYSEYHCACGCRRKLKTKKLMMGQRFAYPCWFDNRFGVGAWKKKQEERKARKVSKPRYRKPNHGLSFWY